MHAYISNHTYISNIVVAGCLCAGLLCLPVTAVYAQEGALSTVDMVNEQESAKQPLTEYDNVPVGFFSLGVTDEVAEEYEDFTYMRMPGEYKIPGAPEKTVEKKRVLSFQQIRDAYRQKEYALALENLKPMVANKQHDAEELMAIMYLNGQGVNLDVKEAERLLLLAAEGDRPVAHHYLANLYYNGYGNEIPADKIKGLMWLDIAILHYGPGAGYNRAVNDRDNAYVSMTRLEKQRARDMARNWLEARGKAQMMDIIR